MLTNELGLPEPFVRAATSGHKYTPKRYSVSDVLGGTCEAVLKRRHHGGGHRGRGRQGLLKYAIILIRQLRCLRYNIA